MTHLQRLQVQQSEKRQRVNALLQQEQRSDEEKMELDTLTKELQELEPQIRAALVAGDVDPNGQDGDGDGDGDGQQQRADEGDKELQERQQLADSAQLSNYFRAALSGVPLEGKERELNQALGIPADGQHIPMIMLVETQAEAKERGDEEQTFCRADAVTDLNAVASGRTPGRFLERIFAWAACRWLGVTFESVPVGERVHHVFGTGSTAETVARGAAQDDAAAGIAAVTMSPNRLTAGYTFQLEDVARIAGLEARLRSDLSMAMSDAMDAQVFAGNAQLTSNGLKNVAGAVAVGTYTAADFDEFLNLIQGLIDGLYARSLRDIRIAWNPLAFVNKILPAGKADQQTLFELLTARGLMQDTSANIKLAGAAVAKSDQIGYASLGMGLPGSAVAAVWPSMQLIRDPYTEAAEGQVKLTAITMWDFAILRAANWKRFNVTALA